MTLTKATKNALKKARNLLLIVALSIAVVAVFLGFVIGQLVN